MNVSGFQCIFQTLQRYKRYDSACINHNFAMKSSELPITLDDAVIRAVNATLSFMQTQQLMRCRIDFDISLSDKTFTSLKNTMPMLKKLSCDLVQTANSTELLNNTSSSIIRLFFPDMGAAALTRRDWKLGTSESEVPSCVRASNIQSDSISDDDIIAILVCPQSTELEVVKSVLVMCDQRNIPCILINPDLINSDLGLGLRKYCSLVFVVIVIVSYFMS